MNSKQVVAVISAVVLVFILVYPSISVGSVSVSLSSTKITNAQHVYVTINGVWAHSTSQAGWTLISNQTVTIDLVSLENSSRLLGSGQIASGDYDSVRLGISNATWVFNNTRTNLGIATPEIAGTVTFTVGAAKSTTVQISLTPQKEFLADSQYFTGTITAALTP